MPAYVYILSNKLRTTLYIGSTSDLSETLFRHKLGIQSAITKKYRLHYLIYLETFPGISLAEMREQQLKKWRRETKWKVIFSCNPLLREMNSCTEEMIVASDAFQ